MDELPEEAALTFMEKSNSASKLAEIICEPLVLQNNNSLPEKVEKEEHKKESLKLVSLGSTESMRLMRDLFPDLRISESMTDEEMSVHIKSMLLNSDSFFDFTIDIKKLYIRKVACLKLYKIFRKLVV